MIQRSRLFKLASWMCIMLTVNVCAYDVVLARSGESARPAGSVTTSDGGSGRFERYLAAPHIELAQSDTTGVSVKTGSLQTSKIRFVRLPGREGLSTLWPRDTRPTSAAGGTSSSVGDRAVASRVWFLPGREGYDAPGTSHWRRVEPESQPADGEMLPLLVTDGPRADEDRADHSRPVYRKWWFWALGAVAIGTTAALLAHDGESDNPVPRRDLPDFPGPPER
jgi:hypothetical protein